MPRLTKEMEDELEVMKRLQEDRLHESALEMCFSKCVTNVYFPNLTSGEKTCLLNCAEQHIQTAIAVNKMYTITDLGKLLNN